MEYTKEFIKEKISTSDNWLYRGVLAIYGRQTDNEQVTQSTKENNGIGFNGCDAQIMSSFAEQLSTRGFLTDKQKVIARNKMIKYCGQLSKIANANVKA